MSLLSGGWRYQPNVAPENLDNAEYMELTRETYKEKYSPSGTTMQRVFICQWSQRTQMVTDLVGYSRVANNGGVLAVSWPNLPDPHPEFPGYYCTEADVEPYPTNATVVNNAYPQFLTAKVSATYRFLPYDVLADNQVTSEQNRFTDRKYATNAENFTLQGVTQFVASQRILNKPPIKRVFSMLKTMTWYNVPALTTALWEPPNLTAIKSCLGRVNSVAFDVSQGNHAPGTVLCIGVDPKPQPPKLGDAGRFFDIEMKFLVMDNGLSNYGNEHIGHQFVYDQSIILNSNPPVSFGWDLLTSNGQNNANNGGRLYSTANLNTLWTLG